MSAIVTKAKTFIGQREIPPNKGFRDKDFDKQMKEAGFYPGAAWCGFFCRVPWKGDANLNLITGSAVQSMKKAAKAGNFHKEPIPGAVVIYRNFKGGKPQSTGHMGIVSEVLEKTFNTVEGNTTAKGGREGIIVAERLGRSYKWNVSDGLRLMGFIYPHSTE